jgi:hypothetical protein
MKKILGKNPKITNFCLTEMLYTLKKYVPAFLKVESWMKGGKR